MGLFDRFRTKEKEAAAQVPRPSAPPTQAPPQAAHVNKLPGLTNVKHIIAIASGKGGVGKSTLSANLAVSLAKQGHRVGLMDADIYGPSQGTMMGSQERPKNREGQILPLEAHAVKFISMSAVLGDHAPVIWRAPMATKAISQFLNVAWGELDYLLIDLPPGTGDIQITLAQQASLSGVLLVTTPQQVATQVAQKGLQMFKQVNVPILGVVENMRGHSCESCGHINHVFAGEGGVELAKSNGVDYLGSIPLDPAIVEASDKGEPLVAKASSSKSVKAFEDLAKALVKSSEKLADVVDEFQPEFAKIDSEGHLKLAWKEGLKGRINAYDLRISCPCAKCVDENTGQRTLDPASIPLDIRVTSIRPVGRYGVMANYSYPHDTGIFKFERLKQLVEASQKTESFSI